MPRLLVALAHDLPYWTLGAEAEAVLRAESAWEIDVARDEAERAALLARRPDALWCWHADASDHERAPSLRWVSTPAAGADYLAAAELLGRGLRVTVSHGHHGPAMAEHALGLALALARGLDQAGARAAAGEWWRAEFGELVIDALDAPCVVAGVGGIGDAIAQRCLAFGMRVTGLGRHSRSDGAYPVVGPDEHDAALQGARFVFDTLPGTPATAGFFSAARLAALATPAVFVNVGRGTTVDEPALIAAVADGRLRAGLDVLAGEPAAADHPLRRLPGCLLTPHVAAVTPRYLVRAAHQQVGQMRRFVAGESLRWQVAAADLPTATRRL